MGLHFARETAFKACEGEPWTTPAARLASEGAPALPRLPCCNRTGGHADNCHVTMPPDRLAREVALSEDLLSEVLEDERWASPSREGGAANA